jgi:hypothetical protein
MPDMTLTEEPREDVAVSLVPLVPPDPDEPGLIMGRPVEDRGFELVEAGVGAAAGVAVGTAIAEPIGAAVGGVLGTAAGPLGAVAGGVLGAALGLAAGEAIERRAGRVATTTDAEGPEPPATA